MVIENALLLIESAYTKFIAHETNEAKLCKDLALALNALPFENKDKVFSIEVANHSNSEKFFGMRVFPSIEEMEGFCNALVDDVKPVKYKNLIKRWQVIKNWTLEIDATCFTRSTVNFTPKELTALTLHEIGHIIYSEKPVEVFYRAYLENKSRLTSAQKATQKLMYSIYMIPLSIACMQRRWINDKNQVNIEIVADKTVAELGYGDNLVAAFNKIIRTFGGMHTTDSEQEAEVKTSVSWCTMNIADVMKRKESLKDELYYQGIKNKSNFMKAVTIKVLDKIGFKLKERYSGYVVENTIELLSDPNVMEKYVPTVDSLVSNNFDRAYNSLLISNDIATEAFNKRKKVKVELPSQYEIDAIAIEVDKISNHHDRLFVLDLIYEILDRVNTFEEAISLDPTLVRKWDSTIQQMRADLDRYRTATLEKKSFSKGYKFFVKVPEDYEG
jgi:hypothetical protein